MSATVPRRESGEQRQGAADPCARAEEGSCFEGRHRRAEVVASDGQSRNPVRDNTGPALRLEFIPFQAHHRPAVRDDTHAICKRYHERTRRIPDAVINAEQSLLLVTSTRAFATEGSDAWCQG